MADRREQSVDLGALFAAQGLPRPVVEYRFHPERMWRWDFAWIEYRVCLERQGGTWTGGRHVRGAEYAKDCAKLAEGQLAGWLCVWATSDMLADGSAFQLVRRALEARGWRG